MDSEIEAVKRGDIKGMEKNKILISTDCTSDLTPEHRKAFGISIMYGYVVTEEGRYQDTSEVTSDNLIEYMVEEKKEAFSDVASIEEYKEYFEGLRKKTENAIIHIASARYVSAAYNIALEAAASMQNVFVVDSGQLSGGLGIVVLKVADLAARGASLPLLLNEVKKNKEKVFSSFIAEYTRFLYKNGSISENIHRLNRIFGMHPILKISEGRMVLGALKNGNRKRFVRKYIRWALRHPRRIDTDIVYVVFSGYSYEYLDYVKTEIKRRVPFKKIVITDASASISANSGPGVISVYFVRR